MIKQRPFLTNQLKGLHKSIIYFIYLLCICLLLYLFVNNSEEYLILLYAIGVKCPLHTLVLIVSFFSTLRLTLITVFVSVSATNTLSGDNEGDDEGSAASLTGDRCMLVGKILPVLLSKLQSSSKNPDSSEEVEVFIWVFWLPWLFWVS